MLLMHMRLMHMCILAGLGKKWLEKYTPFFTSWEKGSVWVEPSDNEKMLFEQMLTKSICKFNTKKKQYETRT
jgi:hypothetical protein